MEDVDSSTPSIIDRFLLYFIAQFYLLPYVLSIALGGARIDALLRFTTTEVDIQSTLYPLLNIY